MKTVGEVLETINLINVINQEINDKEKTTDFEDEVYILLNGYKELLTELKIAK